MSNRDRPTAPSPTLRRSQFALLIGFITLLGFALRIILLDTYPFHEDEAIYSFWALHTWPNDPFFLDVWPDKPPLFIWLLAAVFRLFGTSVASARWLNIAVSTLTIPVVAAIANVLWTRQAWGRWATLLAALAMALNPYAISFAPTAFTDPLLVFFGSLSLLLTLHRRPFWAGIFLGAAIMTKQQGLLYAPLILGLWLMPAEAEDEVMGTASSFLVSVSPLLRLLIGLTLITVPIIYWDSVRWAVAPSPWDLSARNYGGLTLASPSAWLERALAWGALVWELAGSWLIWGGLVLLWVYWLMASAVRDWEKISQITRILPSQSRNGRRVTWTPWRVIVLWAIGYLCFHVVANIQIWDRYLLPLAPVFALFVGWSTAMISADSKPRTWLIATILCALLLFPPAWTAARGQTPVGGDHGAYDGLHEALAWIEHETPDEAILYHRELGWHYQFYLFEEVEEGRYQLRWFPNAVTLADNVTKSPHPRKFYIEPAWAPLRDPMRHMDVRNVELTERARFGQMTVYELTALETDPCDWRFSSEERHSDSP